jgi:NAD(P)-dependent dehydrogenase (short-subunit alcohol dehydrogenase family)
MISDLFNLKNKVIAVYGGSGKIGSHLVENLVKTGAKIISISSTKENFTKVPEGVFQYSTDLSNEISIREKIEIIVSDHGVPDVVINSAVGRPKSKNDSLSIESWKKSMDINITGAFLLLKNYCELMKIKKSGSIININSIYGTVAPNPNLYDETDIFCEPDYCASKGALTGLTKYFSSMYGKFGIRTNCISPGGIFNNQEPKFVMRYSDSVPLGRMAELSDLFGVIVMLASDASLYITGSNIVVDGGYTIR